MTSVRWPCARIGPVVAPTSVDDERQAASWPHQAVGDAQNVAWDAQKLEQKKFDALAQKIKEDTSLDENTRMQKVPPSRFKASVP